MMGPSYLNRNTSIKDLLTKSKMDKVKSIATPMVSGLKLSKLGSDTMSNATLTSQLLGHFNMLL